MRRLMTSMSCVLAFALSAALLVAAAPARAQDAGRTPSPPSMGQDARTAAEEGDDHPTLEEPRSRQGYWIGFGASGVAVQSWEKGRDRGIYGGYTGTLRIGQLITQRVGLGVLIEYVGSIEKGSDKGALEGLTLEGSVLVWRNLSLHGGFGLGVVLLKDNQAVDPSYRAGGGSYFMLGTSYDIFPFKKRLTGGWAITPVIDVHGSHDGSIHFLALVAGVQLTWWSGLPSNMLKLPEE